MCSPTRLPLCLLASQMRRDLSQNDSILPNLIPQSHLIPLNVDKCCIPSTSLLKVRLYGGTGIFISRHLRCAIEPVVSDYDRICAIHVKFNSVSIIMPCDTPANADTSFQLVGALQELRIRYGPDYVA